jgi:hypothetical protein
VTDKGLAVLMAEKKAVLLAALTATLMVQ